MRLRTTVAGDEERPDPEEDATPAAIRDVLYVLSMPELWYGTEFEFRPDDATAPRLTAFSVANTYIGPEAPGEFFLGLEEHGVFFSEAREWRFTREQVRDVFERFAAGDWAWLDDFTWEEVVRGRRTGRRRDRAAPDAR
jgi:hypothetical protein